MKLTVMLTVLMTLCSLTHAQNDQTNVFKNFNIFVEVFDLVQAYYLERVDSNILIEGAINGMILEMDRYGYYEPDTGFVSYNENFGVGLICGIKNGNLTILRVVPNSPAAKEDLLPGDYILTIGEKIPAFLTMPQINQLFHPSPGKKIELQIFRESEKKVRELSLEPAPLEAEPAFSSTISDGVMILTIHNLTVAETVEQIQKLALDNLQSQQLPVLFDLRFCCEGTELMGLKLADLFLEDGIEYGSIIEKRYSRETPTEKPVDKIVETWTATDGVFIDKLPIAVMINQSTYAGGETFAVALHKAKRATLIGKPSFGRGIHQTRKPLEDGGALILTDGFYKFTDRPIYGTGVIPDMYVDEPLDFFKSSDHVDETRAKAIEVLKAPHK